jgi:2-oxoglutarate ferredoxin oxidoreductase subunit beta
MLDKLIEKAMLKKGFSLVEIMTPCPTTYGRRNREGDAVAMTADLKKRGLSQARLDKLGEEERENAIPTGVFVDIEKPEYTEQYQRVIEQAGGPAAGSA